MPSLFSNQVVVITGAGRGIGAAAARIFAQEGAQVVVNDLSAEPAAETVDAIRNAGGDAIAFPGSVTEPTFAEQLLQAAVDAYGKINVLVNNAGYTWDGMLHKMSDEQWQAILDVHLTAPFRLVRAAAPHMREVAKAEIAAHGQPVEPRCIVNVSSTSGLHGNIGQINYAAGKMGIVGVTKTIAKEWGVFGIRCNAVAFGYIDTRLTQAKEKGETIDVNGQAVALGIPSAALGDDKTRFIPLQRAGSPAEAAGGIILMASPYASYITGHTLEVTGGSGI
ncbi:MAG: SDR family NAD(P)-dependent oxidoreductase [Caldilineaceae bacterium]|nr:SDR family NAD(P)-dependent oxidoreductase [Caldilineaceae bacterium]